MADFSKESEEFKMFGEYYNLTKKWYDGIKDMKEYETFSNEINAFTAKYKNGKCGVLARKLAMALNNYVDELYYAHKATGIH